MEFSCKQTNFLFTFSVPYQERNVCNPDAKHFEFSSAQNFGERNFLKHKTTFATSGLKEISSDFFFYKIDGKNRQN